VGAVIIGIGGSTRSTSVTDQLLRLALGEVEALGARSVAFPGELLAKIPLYGTEEDDAPSAAAAELAAAVAGADGVILATPGYHGAISGLVKNALDHLELLRADRRPYLEGRPVGVIVTAAGWQACGSTLVSVRSTVHELRGWPTPFGLLVNTTESVFDAQGAPLPSVADGLALLARQVVTFGREAP